MSDPVEDANPETVLSSVRRIVTDTEINGSDTKSVSPGKEALILTTALRVDTPLEDVMPEEISKAEKLRSVLSTQNAEGSEKKLEEAHPSSEHIIGRKSTASLKTRSNAGPSKNTNLDEPPAPVAKTTKPLRESMAEPLQQEETRPEPLEITNPDRGNARNSQRLRIKRPQRDADASDMEKSEVDLGDLGYDIIDEDTLRDMVAEIVKEELTGALGERVTRNIRKLVRREIHRAMMSDDLE